MAVERTYVMLKPDALQRGIAGQIIARIERRGYRIATMKTMQLDEAILREHYAHIADQPYFPATVEYMTSGPVVAMVVEGEQAIQGVRQLMGPTAFEKAVPGTIRGDYAASTTRNLIHGSVRLGLPGRRSCAFSGRRSWPEPKAVHFAGTA